MEYDPTGKRNQKTESENPASLDNSTSAGNDGFPPQCNITEYVPGVHGLHNPQVSNTLRVFTLNRTPVVEQIMHLIGKDGMSDFAKLSILPYGATRWCLDWASLLVNVFSANLSLRASLVCGQLALG